jgi:magnesium-transporting ATPase (P-type)
MIDQMYLMLFNLLFTSLPPVAVGVFDRKPATTYGKIKYGTGNRKYQQQLTEKLNTANIIYQQQLTEK